MAANLLLVEVARWLAATFGQDVLVSLTANLQHRWRQLFAARNILILGPKQSGKSSLVQYLGSGKPYEVVDGEIRPPAPTALAAVVDEKFSIHQGSWLRLKRDVPGDIDLRDAWAQAIADIRPHGIVYLVDGRRDDEALRAEVMGLREFVLPAYPDGLGHLAALHVFVNFSDQWGHTTSEIRRRVRIAREALEEVTGTSAEWSGLRLGVAPTQLSPARTEWAETDRALRHFAADIVA